MTQLTTAVPSVTITETGLLTPDPADVLAGRLTDFDAALGGGMSKDLTTPQGQIASSDSEIIAESQDKLVCLFNMINPDFSTGRFQDSIGKIYFLERKPGQGTSVLAICSGAVGTLIPKGSIATDTAGYKYISENDATISASGSIEIVFRNTTAGALACGVGELNQIYRAVSGWSSITNSVAGVLGNEVESRAAFETRRRQSVAKNSQNLDLSVLAAVLEVDGVVDAYVTSNRTSATVNTGSTHYPLKPHSIYIGLFGGANEDIANAIYNNKAPGCDMNGNVDFTVEQKEGYSPPYPQYVMTWQEAEPTPVYFKVTIKDSDTLPSDIVTEVQDAVISTFNGEDGINARVRIASSITVGRFYPSIINIDPINVNVLAITVSLDNSTFTTDVTMGIDQLPTIDASNITVELV